MSVLPLAGRIDSRTPRAADLDGAATAARPPRWFATVFAPPEQAETTAPTTAQRTTVASRGPCGPEDQDQHASETGTGRNSDSNSQKAYAEAAHSHSTTERHPQPKGVIRQANPQARGRRRAVLETLFNNPDKRPRT
jgi:hypothetical protein